MGPNTREEETVTQEGEQSPTHEIMSQLPKGEKSLYEDIVGKKVKKVIPSRGLRDLDKHIEIVKITDDEASKIRR